MTTIRPPPRVRALMFGLNYTKDASAALQGCHNDVRNMAQYLEHLYRIKPEVYCDDGVGDASTTAQGILSKMYNVCVASHRENLDLVWIHYSGHGSYIRDRSKDEADGSDECLVPTDYATAGMITDDRIQAVFRNFNPRTRVIFVCDSCHSGTIGDVRFSWESPNVQKVENATCRVTSKVITISGCMDDQTSADAWNVMGDMKFVGAMTACLLLVLREQPVLRSNVFDLVASLRTKLRERGFPQVPKLCSTFSLLNDRVFLPSL